MDHKARALTNAPTGTMYSHIEAKLDLLLKMMSKINDFEDRIEHLENALTASDC